MSETLLSAWQKMVRAAPAAPAIIEPSGQRIWTRAELEEAAGRWGASYGGAVGEGQTVVLAEPNGVGWLTVFLGLLKRHAVVAPLDPGEPVLGQQMTARTIGARWLWTGGALHAVESTSSRGRAHRDGRRVLKLTSGSTGTPRALAFTDAQMLADGRQVCAGMAIRADDVNFGLIPWGHSYGLGNLVVPLLGQGTAIALGGAALPQVMAAEINATRATIFPAVPALLRALVQADVAAGQLDSLRTVISAGAPLAPEIAVAFHEKFGRRVHSFYGSSETGGITYDRTGDAALTGRSLGTPLPDVRLEFGRGGRFRVTSPAVFTLGNRHRSPEGLGWHRPADIAGLTADGELALRGRAGRFVKLAGRRLNLAEVERALRALPGVRDALVVLHGERSDALAAAVATDQTAEGLRTTLRERLAGWKVPKKLLVLDAFPLTARGKTDAAELRRRLGSAGSA